jgi:hypothetical protein
LNSFYIMKRVVKAISRAITAVIKNYFLDPRLCNSLLTMSSEATALLRIVEHKPYSM